MLSIYESNDQMPRLIFHLCRNLQKHSVIPELLCFNKVDAMFRAIIQTLCLIKFEEIYSIENIP